jgi:hypothetical protein
MIKRCLKGGGGRQTHVYGCEEQLIACYAGYDGAVCGFEVDVLGQEAVPLCGCRTEDDCFMSG